MIQAVQHWKLHVDLIQTVPHWKHHTCGEAITCNNMQILSPATGNHIMQPCTHPSQQYLLVFFIGVLFMKKEKIYVAFHSTTKTNFEAF